jgi:AmmeMemoRadiSam system protein B
MVIHGLKIRPAAVAGQFYPDDARELRTKISDLLAQARPEQGLDAKAVIAPHAGYVFSGPVAASAYAAFAGARHLIKRVILVGPSHFVPCKLIAASRADAFQTPLGAIPVDLNALRTIHSFPQVGFLEEAHEFEHCLEVQLPFLQVLLADFSIVPLVVGEVPPESICRVLDALWGGPETRLVISSDLSHYHDAPGARKSDAATACAIEEMNHTRLEENSACGRIPLQGLLLSASKHACRARTLDLRNSGDTGGPRDRVVGYGAFSFSE